MTRRVLLSSAVFFSLSACASSTYTPPVQLNIPNNELVVNQNYDQTWDNLVSHASQTFFAIDNFEKATGLMTLSYGSGNPSRYVDCGKISIKSPQTNFEGNYVDYLTRFSNSKLQGRMNLLVQHLDENRTRVRVNTRYIVSIPPSSAVVPGFFGPQVVAIPGSEIAFDSGQIGTATVFNSTKGQNEQRTCRATGVAEQDILSSVSVSNF